jgi:predicted oxidoreductase
LIHALRPQRTQRPIQGLADQDRAVPCHADLRGDHNTMGGIVVDGNGAVLDQSDTPIPGLFAAGSTVGGLDGGPHAGYVGGLIKATVALRARRSHRGVLAGVADARAAASG